MAFEVKGICAALMSSACCELGAAMVSQCLPHHSILVLASSGIQAHVLVSFCSA